MTTRRLLQAAIGLSLVAALLSAAGGVVPYETLQPLGAWVRRPDDVTPERYARYLHVCWFFAAALALTSLLLWRGRTTVERALARTPNVTSTAAASPAGTGRGPLILLGIVLLAGVFLRLQRLNDPVAYDEAYTYLNYAQRPWYEAISDYSALNNHLLNSFLMHWTTRTFGPEEWALRLHVFVIGGLLPILVWKWAADWRGPGVALPAAAMTAVAPLMVTYSTDARGYMLVAAAALFLDRALAEARRTSSRTAWCTAWLAIVLGLWAMPIMAYAVAASCGWYLLLPGNDSDAPSARRLIDRTRAVLLLLGSAGLVVAALYAPAYVFRGIGFARDIAGSAATEGYLALTAEAWRQAFEWWTDGPAPAWLWIIVLAVGSVTVANDGRFWIRWAGPFASVLILNAVQQVAPPTRVFLHLAPWVFLLASSGVCAAGRLGTAFEVRWSAAFTLLIVLGGGAAVAARPVLFDPDERAGYRSVPRVIERLQNEVAVRPEQAHVLIAPLPCDLPAIFYMDRAGFRVPLNVRPESGTAVWLIARPHETPADVLGSDLVGMSELVEEFGPWERVARFDTLDLYSATAP